MWLVGVVVVVGVVLIAMRKAVAHRDVGRLVERGGLPAEPELVADAESWYQRRQVVVVAGLWIGAVVGAGVQLALGNKLAIANQQAMTWVVLAALLGAGIAISGWRYLTIRAARHDGPRTATLHVRRLSDYVTRAELAVQLVMLAMPLVSVVLGLFVLTGDDRPSSGWTLVGAGLAAYPLAAMVAYLQRRMLHLNQPADSESALRWQEAIRAAVLRELGDVINGIGWIFGPGIFYAFEWPTGIPGFVDPLTWVLFPLGSAVTCYGWYLAQTKQGLRRSQRVLEG